jgi:hypothetical protein
VELSLRIPRPKYQLLIIYCAFYKYLGKNGNKFVDFKKAYDSVVRVVFYNILIEYGISMKLVRLINTSE